MPLPSPDLLPSDSLLPFPGTESSTEARQQERVFAGLETPMDFMGNGVLFTFKSSVNTSDLSGEFAYGPDRLSYNLMEAIGDGGVQTQDANLASSLRETGLFDEVEL